MKKLLTILAFVMAAAAALTAHAQATVQKTATVNVNVTLNSGCKLTGPTTAISVTYNALQTSVAEGFQPFTVTCTNGLPYSMGFASTDVTSATLGLTGALSVKDTSGTALAASPTGSGSAQTYRVYATYGANQSGNCTSASCSDNTLTGTLQISY